MPVVIYSRRGLLARSATQLAPHSFAEGGVFGVRCGDYLGIATALCMMLVAAIDRDPTGMEEAAAMSAKRSY